MTTIELLILLGYAVAGVYGLIHEEMLGYIAIGSIVTATAISFFGLLFLYISGVK